MRITTFLNRYGTSTTTNFQLRHWSKELGIKNFHYAMCNEIKNLKRIKKLPIYIIFNYQSSKEPGSHHVAMYKDKDKTYYVDSYGIEPTEEAEDYLEEGINNTFKIQPDGTRMCGQICLWFFYQISQGKDFYKTVIDLYVFFNS